MRGGKLFLCFVLVIAQSLVQFEFSLAAPPSDALVISHVIAGESSSSSSELVAIYNNSNEEINVSGYCIKNKSSVSVSCVNSAINLQVILPPQAYLTFASTIFSSTHNYIPDTQFVSSNSVQVGGDELILIDTNGVEVDKISWGSSGGGISLTTNGTMYRKQHPNLNDKLLDTGSMSNDFTSVSASLLYPSNESFERALVTDACPNVEEFQDQVPEDFLLDDNGNCQVDSCINIDGLQLSVPDGYDSDDSGTCFIPDSCSNIEGQQNVIPPYMVRSGVTECIWNIAPLILSELMPNPLGSDIGNEFIEIFNPTNNTIDLGAYSVAVGVGADKYYAFPIGSMIGPGEYRIFTDSEMKFTLVNTTGRVVLRSVDNYTWGDSGVYENAAEGFSWSYIGGLWRYTNVPTPGTDNLASTGIDDDLIQAEKTLLPCPVGKYRNPLTNRCRSIGNDALIMAACGPDQYRNPDSGRCKKITSVTLTPCKDGQYRSEETNRCRNIVTTSNRKPCKDNQYRSEETGRCRNLVAAQVPGVGYGVQKTTDSTATFVGWGLLGISLCLVLVYAFWEWRQEIRSLVNRIHLRIKSWPDR